MSAETTNEIPIDSAMESVGAPANVFGMNQLQRMLITRPLKITRRTVVKRAMTTIHAMFISFSIWLMVALLPFTGRDASKRGLAVSLSLRHKVRCLRTWNMNPSSSPCEFLLVKGHFGVKYSTKHLSY